MYFLIQHSHIKSTTQNTQNTFVVLLIKVASFSLIGNFSSRGRHRNPYKMKSIPFKRSPNVISRDGKRQQSNYKRLFPRMLFNAIDAMRERNCHVLRNRVMNRIINTYKLSLL